MFIKNNQNSNKSIEQKQRIVRISILTLGTLLVTGIAFKNDGEKEKTIPYNQELDENLYEPKQIRNYENKNFEDEYIVAELKDFNTKSNLNSQAILYTNMEEKVADDVICGYYGNGESRKTILEESGYDYERIQF